ncbi:MAG: HYR domain-containing protein [Bacteroidota bacterium]
MKKFLLLLYSTALLVLTAVPVSGQTVTIIGEQVVSCPDAKATVDISVENFIDVQSAQFGVSWDTSVIRFCGFTPNLPPTVILPNAANATNGFYFFSWFDAVAPPGDYPPGGSAVLFTMEFEVIGTYGESSPITIGDLPGFDVEIFLTDFTILGSGDVNITNGELVVDDVTPPVISNCPSDQLIIVPNGQTSSVATWVEPDTTDNCEMASLISTNMSGESFPLGTTTVTYTATDVNGNTNDVPCSFDITVQQAAGNPNSLTFSALGTSLSCSDSMFSVPIIVENFDDMTIVDLGIQWDTSVLRYCGVMDSIVANNPLGSAFYNEIDSLNGRLIFSWFYTNAAGLTLTDSTTIFTLKFKLKDSNLTSTTVEITNLPGFLLDFWNASGQISVNDVTINNATINVVPDEQPEIVGGCPDRTIFADADCSVPLPNYIDSLTFNDDCTALGDLVFNQTPDSLTTNVTGDLVVTVTVTDEGGNDSTCTFNVTFIDTIPPVPDVAVLPDVTGECSATVTAPTATDNCSGTVTGTTTDPLTYTTQGTFTVTWTYDDGNGNTSTQTQTVIVDDTTAPVADVAMLPDVTGECTATVTAPMATDNCTGAVTGTTTDPLTYTAQGTFTVTWTYDDGNGNTSTQTQTVVVDDMTAPVADVAMLPDVTGECTATVTAPTATDNCTGAVMGTTTDPLTYTTQGTFTVTWTYDDGNGNTSTQTQTVIVDDMTDPVADVAVLPDVTGECTATVTAPTATDNCTGAVTGTTTDPLTYTTQGTFTVTWTYDDGNGNTSTQTQTVIVDDTTAPVADVAVLPDVTGECTATVTAPTATDNCSGTVTGTTTDPLTYSAQGTFTVTWTYDDGNGNTSTQTQTVIVDDTTAPVADVAMLPNVTGECTATVTAPTATDNCTGAVTGTTTDPLTYTAQGTFTVTWTYDDGNGNTSTQTQTVIVDDTTAPVADVAVLPDVTGECTATVTAPTATDNCTGAVTGTTTDPLTYTAQGTFTVTWTYDDGNGNTSTQTQTVIVDDLTNPTISCPADLTVAINANCEANLDDYTSMATVSDNCSMAANITIAQVPTSGTVISADTDVTLTATDEAGNAADCSFKVVIDDQTDPTAICVSDTTVYLDNLGMVTINTSYVDNGSFDNCPTLTLNIDQNTFDCSDIGDNTVTLTVTDGNSNFATCTANVMVVDTIPPQLVVCAPDTFLLADANCEAVLPDFTALTVFADNCTPTGNLKITQVPPSGTIISNDTTVAVVALDSVGLVSDTCFFLVELIDSLPPTITCPADIVVDASLDSCGATVFWAAPILDDNCGIGTVICDPDSGSFFPVGDSIVTCIVTDVSNNADTCMFTVTVNDTQPPFLACPADTTVFIAGSVADTMIFDIGLDSLSDNCMVDTFFHTFSGAMMGSGDGDASGTSFVPGETTVTYTAVDGSGNMDSCSFVVNILQSVIIDLVCPSNYSVPTDAGQCSAVVDTDAPSVDPVTGVDTIYYVLTNATTGSGPDSVPDDQVFNAGTTTVTYTAVSVTNDTSICSFTVTVTDQEDPVITCPSTLIEIDNTTDSCGVIFDANLQLATATDNCPGVLVTYSVVSGALLPVGTNTITATATDQGTNSASCTYEVMVRDTQPPLISPCPADIIVNNDLGICGAVVTWTPPTATDNCGVLFIEPTPYEPGDTIPVGVEFITYTASDAAGNVTECIFSVTVRDTEMPNLNPCPDDITVSNDPGECSAVVTWPFIQPTDNCNVVSFVVLPQSGSTFPIGSTQVQAVATDGAGEVNNCSFVVTVNDTEFPTMNNFPGNITVNNDPGMCGAIVNWSAIQVDDNCGIDTFYCNMNSGDVFPAGMTTVECTVIDENGNAFTDNFSVTVIDNEDPVVDCPQDILIFVDGSVVDDPSGFIADFQAVACDSVVLNYNNLTATDNCAIASVSQTVGPVSGSTFEAGQQIITYSIQDVNANDVTCSFAINVEGVPDATAGASPNNPCEGGEVLFFTQNTPGASYEWVDPNGMVISNEASFSLANMTMSMSGTYEVTITFPFNCVQKATVDVNVFPNPGLTIMSNDLLCTAAGTPLVLEAMDSANSNITSYQWATPGGALFIGNPITVTSPLPGTYSLVATTANGCQDTASVLVEISTIPETPDLTGPAEACIGEPILLDGEEFSGPGILYHWAADPDLATAGINDINNHNNEANPTTPGTYTYYFFVTQGGCISDSAEWVVVVEDFPSFQDTIIGNTDCVDGTTDVIITALNSMPGLTWSIDGPCDPTQQDSLFTFSNVDASCSGLYTLTAMSGIGCSASQTVSLSITDKPVTPVLQATSDTICMGGSTTLFLTNTPSGANLLCYENGVQVSCSIIGNAIQPSTTTEYGVQFDINGCTSDTTFIDITVEAPIDIQITPIGDVTCVSGSDTVTLVTQAGGGTYVWDGPCGVQVGDELLIPNIDPGCSGLYSVSVTGALGQCLSIGELQLEVTGMLEPIMAVQLDTACEGGDVSFCAEPEILGATYTWTDPFGNVFSNERCPSTPAIQATAPYSVEVDLEGCTSSDDVLVNVLTAPIAKDETVVGIVDAPQSFNVIVNDELANDNYSISVVQDPTNGSVSYNGEGVFTYTPNRGFRQTDIMAYEICYDDCPELCDIAIVTILVRYPVDQCIATTVITPNDDGINDEFIVSCLELGGCPNNQLFIFNQWGDQVFEAAPYDNTWKGTYKDRDLPDGTYYFIFKCDNSSEAEKGFVVIHR